MLIWTVEEQTAVSDGQFMEELYQDYKRLMFSVAGKYSAAPQDGEDIVQDALERLIRRADALKTLEPGALASYISFTVRSSAIDLLRRQERYVDGGAETEARTSESLSADLDEALIAAERARGIHAALERLPADQRLVLEGKYFYDQTDEELAALAGCKSGSVRMKLTRARRALQDILRRGGDGSEDTP